jgi:mevalonate kinase
MPATSRFAPGKMILCGEHAVVYQQPAIAIPVLSLGTTTKIFAHPLAQKGEVYINAKEIDLQTNISFLSPENPIRQTVELVMRYFFLTALPACEIQITSTLPIAAGMGSSASLSVSLIRALSDFLGQPLQTEQMNALAYEAEKFHHGNPSGVDNTVISYARPVYYIRGENPEFLSIGSPFHFIVANTGISASTSLAVAGVRERWLASPTQYENYFTQIGSITEQVRQALALGNPTQVGQFLTKNHQILQEMHVSCLKLDHLVNTALSAGALGAKLSGGGLGGNMLALVGDETAEQVEKALIAAGARSCLRITLPASKEK